MKNTSDAFNDYMSEIERTKFKINSLSKELESTKNKYQELISSTISIKLSDLVHEMAKLVNSNVLDMNIEITTNMFVEDKSEFTLENLSNRIYSNLEVSIEYGKSTEKLYLYTPLDFYSKFTDGTILFDHCSLVEAGDEYEIVVNRHIGGLICKFSFEKLIKDSYHVASPSLLQEAIKNCYNNGKLYSPQSSVNHNDEIGQGIK